VVSTTVVRPCSATACAPVDGGEVVGSEVGAPGEAPGGRPAPDVAVPEPPEEPEPEEVGEEDAESAESADGGAPSKEIEGVD